MRRNMAWPGGGEAAKGGSLLVVFFFGRVCFFFFWGGGFCVFFFFWGGVLFLVFLCFCWGGRVCLVLVFLFWGLLLGFARSVVEIYLSLIHLMVWQVQLVVGEVVLSVAVLLSFGSHFDLCCFFHWHQCFNMQSQQGKPKNKRFLIHIEAKHETK